MAIEKNPFDKIEETISNVVKLPEQIKEATGAPSFEVEDDGGVTVDFTQVNIEMEPKVIVTGKHHHHLLLQMMEHLLLL